MPNFATKTLFKESAKIIIIIAAVFVNINTDYNNL